MQIIRALLITTVLFGCCLGFRVPRAKALVVNCQSQSGTIDFHHRLKWRTNAADQATILLFGGEQLKIHFYLNSDATVEVLDVRYSNDGDLDDVTISLDDTKLGEFKTQTVYAWGKLWNIFRSSGPIGGQRFVKSGEHTVTLTVDDSDEYGVEIDYIRVNVHGARIQSLENEHFFCEHKQRQGTRFGKL